MEARTAPEEYWHKAGELGYDATYYSSRDVGQHISLRMRTLAIDIARRVGIDADAHVLDLGCGDGAFANEVLSHTYRAVDGFDLSEAGIARARKNASRSNVRFDVCDISTLGFARDTNYDGVFLMGILHHVKQATPSIVTKLRTIARKVVVLEPNGDNFIRKALEFTPSYKAAGEDSFRTREVEAIFKRAGYQTIVWRRVNLFPNFTPGILFRSFRRLEPVIEQSVFWRALCTVNLWGFGVD